jgi:tetratricopeptide (TPR) repeat protein
MREPTTLLQALMAQRRWTRERTLEELERRARRLGERDYALSLRQLDRWFAGEVGTPRPGTCRVVEEEFGYPIAALLGPFSSHDEAQLATAGVGWPADLPTSATLGGVDRLPLGGACTDSSERLVIMGAAHEAGRQAEQAAAGDVPTETIEQLHEHVVRLSVGYLSGPMLPMWVELRAVRTRTFELLDRTQRLGQRHDLYLLAGMVSCVLAGTSGDLGYPAAAMEWARAAATYGELIGHDSLRAYATGQLAMFHYLEGNPRRALRHARDAQQLTVGGSAMVRLRGLEALACSRLGDAAGTVSALMEAELERQRGSAPDELHDRTPGMFTTTPAKLSYMAAMALTNVGDHDRAADQAQQAIRLYTSGPPEELAQGAVNVARIDLATAYLAQRELDAAQEALTGVLAVAPDERTTIIVTRIAGLHGRLATGDFRHDRQATQLAEAIEDFRAGAAAHQLPGR